MQLLALGTGRGGVMSQGMGAASRGWKKQGSRFLLELQEERGPADP